MIELTETKYGFRYGSAEVTRIASDKKKGWVVLEIRTLKDFIQVYATKTGKIRVYNKRNVEINIL